MTVSTHGLVDQSPISNADEPGSAISGGMIFSFLFFLFFFYLTT